MKYLLIIAIAMLLGMNVAFATDNNITNYKIVSKKKCTKIVHKRITRRVVHRSPLRVHNGLSQLLLESSNKTTCYVDGKEYSDNILFKERINCAVFAGFIKGGASEKEAKFILLNMLVDIDREIMIRSYYEKKITNNPSIHNISNSSSSSSSSSSSF